MDSNVRDFIAKEVPDWNNEVITVARFKAFSGQRSDWQPNFIFWRDLIIKIATHFRFLIIQPSQVKNDWFNRGGLTPLCIDDVL
ncbi:charged multivesicular body protein 7-like, partial [Trifolium medium]|nr:charged multivesicular body protein 7-like [Trifolium medium]